MGRQNYFGIHGLWPEYKMNCGDIHWTENDLSEENKIDLMLYWNSMYNSEMGFINHELAKHATCWKPHEADPSQTPSHILKAISKYDLNTNHGKFNAFLQIAISWSKKHNLYEILRTNGIIPKDNEKVSTWSVLAAFDKYFNVQNSAFPICIKKRKQSIFWGN